MHKSQKQNCIVKQLWEWATPYQQIIGYFALLGTVVCAMYQGFSFFQQAQAAIISVQQLETWKGDTDTRIAVMAQEVHDIHGWIRHK